ncbi:MAG: glycoside hydrolase family 13 protein, partial [Lachnospiraceae bacterium]|nr:glycoside hydrolase family 13 protein [Candidatus Equihabitans merdae]
NPSNDVMTNEYYYLNAPVRHIDDWDAPPESMEVGHFKGGDLQGVLQELDHIQELGVEVLYFNPIFVSPSNHKYDTQDYEHIDPHLTVIPYDEGALLEEGAKDNKGAERYRNRVTNPDNLAASDAFFAKFMEEVHRRGMKVILDGVFNHCGSFNKWLNRERLYRPEMGYEKGAYESSVSPYRYYFDFHRDEWPDNEQYDGWWGHATLPKLNFEASMDLQEHILSIAEKWLKPPYCVDGWRLDVAADLGHTPEFNHYFWQCFRKRVKAANPDACILAEHYGDPSSYLQGGEWDTIMNYDAFMEPVTFFLTGMEKHSDGYFPEKTGDGRAFFDTMKDKMRCLSGQSLMSAMNELDNHDHSRFITRTNHKVGRVSDIGSQAAGEDVSYPILRQALMMQMTWIGAPTIYYGDETAVPGFTDPDNRRTYPWGHENKEVLAFYKAMGRLRHRYQVLREGSWTELYESGSLIAYGRFDEEEAVITVINASSEASEAQISLTALGISFGEDVTVKQVLTSSENGWSDRESVLPVNLNQITVPVQENGGVILSIKR